MIFQLFMKNKKLIALALNKDIDLESVPKFTRYGESDRLFGYDPLPDVQNLCEEDQTA
jgi:hypothetical protein